MGAEGRHTVRAINRGLKVLQVVNSSGSLSMTHIATRSKMPYPTTCRIVQTLCELGMIEREPGRKRYRPTALVQTLSMGYQREDRIAAVARPHLAGLTSDIVWPAYLSSRLGHHMVVKESTDAMTTLVFNRFHPGYLIPLFESSSGRAHLAFCDDEERHLIAKSLDSEPRATHAGVSDLWQNVERVRSDGYAAIANHWYLEPRGKTSAISVPILESNRSVAVLSVLFFSSVMSTQEASHRFLGKLHAAAGAIAKDLAA